MIIIRRRQLILLAVAIGAVFLAFGLYGYHLSTRLTYGADAAVLLGEKLLFAGIAASMATAVLIFLMLRLSTDLERRMDRLIDQGQTRDIVPGRDFVGMGTLGDKLTAMFNLLSKLNDQKTRKISAMQTLAAFLIRNLEVPALVTNITGIIHYASQDFLDIRKLKRQDVIDINVTVFVDKLDLPHLVAQLIRTRKPVEDIAGKIQYSCHPILDKSDEVAYLVFLIGPKSGNMAGRIEQVESHSPDKSNIRSSLGEIGSDLRKPRAGFK